MQSLAFDDPWLAAALDDGSTLLLNVDAAMRMAGGGSGSSRRERALATAAAAAGGRGGGQCLPMVAKRQFVGGASGPAFCVDISDQWMACGTGAHSPTLLNLLSSGHQPCRCHVCQISAG